MFHNVNSDLEERVYRGVERAVLWGEPREEVFRMMETNGLTGDRADAVYQRAWTERLSVLRSEGLRRLINGLIIIGAALSAFAIFWYGFGVITRGIFVLCGLGALWGTWVAIDGLVSVLLAPTKRGSIADDTF